MVGKPNSSQYHDDQLECNKHDQTTGCSPCPCQIISSTELSSPADFIIFSMDLTHFTDCFQSCGHRQVAKCGGSCSFSPSAVVWGRQADSLPTASRVTTFPRIPLPCGSPCLQTRKSQTLGARDTSHAWAHVHTCAHAHTLPTARQSSRDTGQLKGLGILKFCKQPLTQDKLGPLIMQKANFIDLPVLQFTCFSS